MNNFYKPLNLQSGTPCHTGECPQLVAKMAPKRVSGRRVLDFKKVNRHYAGNNGISNIDLEVFEGDILGVCGVSGCGKSTLLRLIAGLEQADSGRIERQYKKLSVVFQDPQLLPWLSALDNVRLVLENRDKETALKVLCEVGLEQAADTFPAQLSGGMRQRVGIARALAGNPDLLLMDEPFASLDYFTGRQLLELVRKRVSERSLTVVFVSHDVREISRLCDQVVVLGNKPGQVLDCMQNPLDHEMREQRPGALAHFEEAILDTIELGHQRT